MTLAQLVTDLGDLLVASAAAAVVLLWMRAAFDRVTATVFAAAFLGSAALVTLLKLISAEMFSAPHGAGLLELSSGAPSGHAALALAAYGSAAVLFRRVAGGVLSLLGQLVCGLAVAGVAVTRVTLDTHSAADVLAGLAVAAPAVLMVALVTRRRPARPGAAAAARGFAVALAAATLVLLVSGARLPSTVLI